MADSGEKTGILLFLKSLRFLVTINSTSAIDSAAKL